MPQSPAVDLDVLCPLCEYNLRGLIDPRCPECGHEFTWPDLLDRSRWDHPWLFEHQRKRRVRSFFRTFFESLLPWRFWRSVRPTHRLKPAWMFVYWLVFFAMTLLIVASPLVRGFAHGFLSGLDPAIARQRAVDFSRELMGVYVPVALMYICWPGVTILVLMIFRQTMRQARIKPDHVVRCAVYSSDAVILMAAPILLLVRHADVLGYYGRFSGWAMVGPLVWLPILGPLLLALLILTWRLATAYRMYLGFPNAIVTCILSQVVVGLAMLTTYLIWATWDW
jgi:hypothetical protein